MLRVLPLRMVHQLGNVLGWLMNLLPSDARRITRTNLALCFPEMSDQDRSQLAEQSLKETAKAALELGKVWMTPMDVMMALVVRTEGAELLETALKAGKGVIVVAPHLGSWEVCGLNITRYGQITSLYKPPKLPGLEKDMNHFRTRGGARTAPTNKKGVMQLVKALQSGEMIGILPDQQPDRNSGVFAPFFGIDALTMTLVSKLAAKTGAAVICNYSRRLPDSSGFEVVFRMAEPGIEDPDPVVSATALNRSVEKCVLDIPAQYQWEYKRFNRRPPGDETRLYAKG